MSVTVGGTRLDETLSESFEATEINSLPDRLIVSR